MTPNPPPVDEKKREARWWLRLTLIAAAVFTGIYFLATRYASGFTAQDMIVLLREYGESWWGPAIFIGAYAVCNLTFIPTQPLSIAAVVVWGWKGGAALEMVAASLGSLPPYYLARFTSREWLERVASRHLIWIERFQRQEFTTLLTLRFIPLVPYTPLNFVAGVAQIRPIPYLVATLVGITPSVLIFAYLVDSIVAGLMSPQEAAMRIIAAGLAFAALTVATSIALRRLNRRHEKK